MASNRGPQGPGAPFQGAPRYIADFSKALASEVRILLQEVGELRDERRRLQQEIAELMAVKSKHGAGGDYSHEWMSEFQRLTIEPPPPGAPPPPPAEEPVLAVARPAWRTVQKKPDAPTPSAVAARRRAGKGAAAAPTPPPPPPEPPKPELPSWAQWKPNPTLAPTPRHGGGGSQAMTAAPPRGGLFGPVTPPPQ
ncbi:hypothetical protein K488DRAFT_88043 [Vararia minispora EC-137]|uniref:Uncharacterized protein n=1 Tax=Vararia minispora EC-137 TaxID=1314806 RepID=A0ACB8QEP2_9AGAM|nr:hypothetical protein K488DRAFT_88043 [Vararia minispora EC-137]